MKGVKKEYPVLNPKGLDVGSLILDTNSKFVLRVRDPMSKVFAFREGYPLFNSFHSILTSSNIF